MTSPGKYRHLAQCSTTAGHFVVLAIDHRANLLDALNRQAPAPLSDGDFTAFKQQVLRHLLPAASAVLADPAHGFGPGIAGRVIGGQVGLLSPVEVTNYDVHPSQRQTEFIPGWSVAKIKRVGGSGVKLLLYYHPDDTRAQGQRELVARIVAECAVHDIPFFLEPIAYSPDPDTALSNDERRQVVVESARTFASMGVDVLKLEFPLDVTQEPDESIWQAALANVTAACGAVPWALLSAGVDYATFRRQAELACAAGCSGVIVGRALWAEAVKLTGSAREQFLAGEGRARMEELAAVCRAGRPWFTLVPPPDAGPGWYERYGS